jgi:L-threonylcarbamoyladenylate synthase
MSILVDCGTRANPERSRGITAAAAAVRRGELIVLPTEAAYGLAADAFSPRGLERLRSAKGRGPELAIPVLVASVRMAEGIVTGLTDTARALIDAFWPGPLTLVTRPQPTLAWGMAGDTLQVRMPLHPLALAVITTTGPLAVSTANIAGAPAPRSIVDAQAQLGDDVTVYLDAGPTVHTQTSSVVDVTGGIPVLLRAGGYDVATLRRACPELIDRS